MSKGTQVYTVRLNEHLVAMVRETIARRNFWTRGLPWTFSDFINIALREKYEKMKRSRRGHYRMRTKNPRPAATTVESPGAIP